MPKLRENQLIQCRYFRWGLFQRRGIWYADGRSDPRKPGRHSLGTTDFDAACRFIHELDHNRAVHYGLAVAVAVELRQVPLSLADGRKLYEEFLQRPAVLGGTRKSTQKRYRSTFDKFLAFCEKRGISTWNELTDAVIIAYAAHLETLKHRRATGYSPKSIRNEVTTLVQAHKWLIGKKHLAAERIHVPIRKLESERRYCYTREEVDAMMELCFADPQLLWLATVILALASTGMRISEVAALKWSDIKNDMIHLTDETGFAGEAGNGRRTLKSGRGRSLPVSPTLAAALKGLPRRGAFVFHGPRGGRLKPDTVRNIFIREVITPLTKRFPSSPKERGFKDGRLHSFRHYFVSTCANQGISERVLMEWLGHADSDMIKHYYHLNDGDSKQLMHRLDTVTTAGQQFPSHLPGTASSGHLQGKSTRKSRGVAG